jgi:hypothetical protein
MKKPPKCASLRGIGGVLLLVKLLSNKNGVFANLIKAKDSPWYAAILNLSAASTVVTNLILFFNFQFQYSR